MKPSDLPPDLEPDSLQARLSEEAGYCVACGLCLPHCPTYRITLSEADSPRGRIALINGAATGRIPMNERFALHIDRCLTCRRCEAVCPNHVHFGELMDGARTMMKSLPLDKPKERSVRRSSRLRTWLEKELIGRPTRIDALRPLLRLYQRSGLQNWMRVSRILGTGKLSLLDAQLPFIDQPRASSGRTRSEGWSSVYPSTGRYRGEVGLFLGCVARLADVSALNAAIFVLNRLGYTVHVPPAQTCCGALHQHGGDSSAAEELALRNASAFQTLNLKAIISTASGCGVQLAERVFAASPAPGAVSPPLLEENTLNSAKGSFPPVKDISAFLAMAEGWDEVRLAPLSRKVAMHEPCTLRNVLGGSAYAYALLARIPGLEVVALNGNDQCCGAAGTYFLDQPEMSRTLLHGKVAASAESGAHYLATSNVGCSMYIASGLREAGAEMEVVHPVTLIARQMGIQ